MTVSEYIWEYLSRNGIDTAYMVSGSTAMWLTDALYRNEGIKAVCSNHEQAAAMAADLYGRTRETIGAVLVTNGPAATNAITGVAQAYTDSSALFVVSGQSSSKLLKYQNDTRMRQSGAQSVSLGPVVSYITKYFAEVMDPADIRYHVERAYYEALNGRKGPVWIDVPVDIQNKPVPEQMKGFIPPIIVDTDGDDKADKLSEVRKKLSASKKPLILAGGGSTREDIDYISEKLHIPVVTSRMGIDRIASDSPYFAGRIGGSGQRSAHFALAQCDVLIILGCRLAVNSTGYYPQRFAGNAFKVHVDIDQIELDKPDVPVDIKLNMKIADFLNQMEELESLNSDGWVAYCQSLVNSYPVVLPEYSMSDPMNSYYFTDILTKLAPDNAIVTVDTGTVCNVAAQTWKVKKDQRFLISGGLSCMGFWAGSYGCCGVGAPVIALSGDGACAMNIQEFGTLKYNNFPVKLFVYNNNGYMLIRHNQHNYMNDRFLGVGPDSGVQTPNYCKVAQAYDIPWVQISRNDDIEQKILDVLHMEGPVICEVILEQFGPMAPRIASKVMPDGSLKAAEFDDMAPFLDDAEKPRLYE